MTTINLSKVVSSRNDNDLNIFSKSVGCDNGNSNMKRIVTNKGKKVDKVNTVNINPKPKSPAFFDLCSPSPSSLSSLSSSSTTLSKNTSVKFSKKGTTNDNKSM